MLILGLFVLIVVMVLFLWWAINVTEGAYLSRRIVIWLYDRYAHRYNDVKRVAKNHERAFLSTPLLAYTDQPQPYVLDVATGTGRLPLALIQHPDFDGHVIGLDLSRKMLDVAAQQLQPHLQQNNVHLMLAAAENLPFLDNSFDVVACLEALEFMRNPQAVLAELCRVLQPGGILLLTNRQGEEARYFPGKTMTKDRFQAMLEQQYNLDVIEYNAGWSNIYALVWACQKGESTNQRQPFSETWCCPHCNAATLQKNENQWQCSTCQQDINMTENGILEFGV